MGVLSRGPASGKAKLRQTFWPSNSACALSLPSVCPYRLTDHTTCHAPFCCLNRMYPRRGSGRFLSELPLEPTWGGVVPTPILGSAGSQIVQSLHLRVETTQSRCQPPPHPAPQGCDNTLLTPCVSSSRLAFHFVSFSSQTVMEKELHTQQAPGRQRI